MRVIAGNAKGISLKTPEGMKTRPTADRVKEAMFSIIQFDLPGAAVLDLFGGTGQLGIEAMSRGAARATFVDEAESACRLIKENVRRAHMEGQSTVIRGDYLSYLSRCREKFRIILLDPPYAEVFLETALKKISEIDILQSGGIIIAERPLGKELNLQMEGYTRSRDYKYGKILLTVYRKEQE